MDTNLIEWPKKEHRYLCTKDKPMPGGAKGQWSHAGAKVTGGNYDGDCDDYTCQDCGKTWTKCYEE